jgi:peptidoglycan/LPS O-acetylase OafA/YrhL
MSTAFVEAQTEDSKGKSVRLHYLDWLRVLAILGVFLFHAVHPFDMFPWEIKNAESSVVVTLFIVFLAPWGMPLFFFLSGVGSWFALRKRTSGQYVRERVNRLLVPFFLGALLLSPIQFYFQWRHQTETGVFEGSLLEFLTARPLNFGPQIFGWIGYHLWFLGFLFAFALIALPLFLWLKGDAGRKFIDWLAKLSEKRGGLLVFIIPLVLFQYILRPFSPAEHDWADFIFLLVFFILGYILYADRRFVQSMQRDWLIMLVLAIISTLFFFAAGAFDMATEWMEASGTPGFYLLWGMWSVNSWCWTMFMIYIGIRYLDFRNKWLDYGQDIIVPFFLFHQPVIILISYFVVQWDVGVTFKLLVVVVSSFFITLGLVELLIRPFRPIRMLFGMKSSRLKEVDDTGSLD